MLSKKKPDVTVCKLYYFTYMKYLEQENPQQWKADLWLLGAAAGEARGRGWRVAA